jgi:hypothetical protein
MSGWPKFRTERSEGLAIRPHSLRLGFLGQPFHNPTRWFWQARGSPALRPSRHRRDQKTFSAGPRSFNAKELWFPVSIAACGVQPVADSRHGRIACKASLSCINKDHKENSRLQSTHRAPKSNPFAGWRLLSKSQRWFIVFLPSSRAPPPSIHLQGSLQSNPLSG